jgi:hypothetical protein
MLNLRAPTVERFNRSSGTGNNRLRPALPIVEKGGCNALQAAGWHQHSSNMSAGNALIKVAMPSCSFGKLLAKQFLEGDPGTGKVRKPAYLL